MRSNEWDRQQWEKHTNPSGEVIRVKTYKRLLWTFDNTNARSVVAQRKQLGKLLGINHEDLLADLEITVDIKRYPRHKRFLKYNSMNTYYKEQHKKGK